MEIHGLMLALFRDSLGWLVFMIFGFQPKLLTSIIINCQCFDYSAVVETLAVP